MECLASLTRTPRSCSTLSLGGLIALSCLWVGCDTSRDASERSEHIRGEALRGESTGELVKLESQTHEVIYGEDTRRDVYELEDPLLGDLARRSIMAMVSASNVNISNTGEVTLRGGTLQSRYQLCADQRYRDQITASSCSATLIDDDIIVTAGHCVESQAECQDKRFVLGYYMESETELAPLTRGDVFSCEQLILSVNNNALDYAFIKLDRPVDALRATPARVTQSAEPLPLNEPLIMMGFPSGLPLKVDDGGFVSDPRDSFRPLNYFRATVDAFGGNSGSGVFNTLGEQVGILVRGEQDYAPSPRGCTVVNELSLDRGPGDDAEELTYLSRALSALCDSGYPSERLCGQNLRGLCFDCEADSDCLPGYQCGRFARYPDAPTFCAPACGDEGTCPEGHTCLSGQCTPSEARSCDGDQVVAIDSCDRQLGLVERCGEGQYCRRGECLEAAQGDVCEEAITLEPTSQQIEGSFREGFTSSATGSCAGGGPEIFYRFELDGPNRMIATARGIDTVLHLRSACDPSAELACVDDSRPPGRYGSQIDARLDAGAYYLALDTYAPDERGDFRLELDFCDQVCALGERRCVVEGEPAFEVCEVNDQGCLDWSAGGSCDDESVCRAGRCGDAPIADTCASAQRIEQSAPEEAWAWRESWSVSHTLALGSGCAPDARLDGLYRVTVSSGSLLTATLESELGVGLALYEGCPLENIARRELTCGAPNMGVSALSTTLAPGEYTLVALGAAPGEYGVTLELTSTCQDECDPSLEPYCAEEAVSGQGVEEVVRACVVSREDGCARFTTIERCGDSVCAGGQCQESCFNVCNVGARGCADPTSPLECVADALGCGVWAELEPCARGEVCAGDGTCVPDGSDWGVLDAGVDAEVIDLEVDDVDEGDAVSVPSPPPSEWVGYEGPREVVLEPRVRGGCDIPSYDPRPRPDQGVTHEISAASSRPLSPLQLSLLALLIGLTLTRRRQSHQDKSRQGVTLQRSAS